jgi:hypothetical protein
MFVGVVAEERVLDDMIGLVVGIWFRKGREGILSLVDGL